MKARIRFRYAGSAACLLLALSIPFSVAADDDIAYDRQIVCEDAAEGGGKICKVDKQTYFGWRTYSSFCLRCHGQDAEGSTFAPSLLDRLKEIDKARFMNSVANGYQGQVGVMPPWKDNPNVTKYYEQIYGFLKARSDGTLLPGRPKRIGR